VKGFFDMGAAEARYLLFLVVFSALSFLPVWREVHIGGMAVFGWLMAALMTLSPLVALLLLWRERAKS
jgi:membrane protein YqaA with SNARE-associated domain